MVSMPHPAHDPDGFVQQDALRPDPVYVGVRSIVEFGPLGAVLRRIDRWREIREERQLTADLAGAPEVATHHTGAPSLSVTSAGPEMTG